MTTKILERLHRINKILQNNYHLGTYIKDKATYYGIYLHDSRKKLLLVAWKNGKIELSYSKYNLSYFGNKEIAEIVQDFCVWRKSNSVNSETVKEFEKQELIKKTKTTPLCQWKWDTYPWKISVGRVGDSPMKTIQMEQPLFDDYDASAMGATEGVRRATGLRGRSYNLTFFLVPLMI